MQHTEPKTASHGLSCADPECSKGVEEILPGKKQIDFFDRTRKIFYLQRLLSVVRLSFAFQNDVESFVGFEKGGVP